MRNSQILAVALMGAGLILLGVVALLLLPKPGTRATEAALGNLPSAVPVQVDFPAPDIELTDLQGKAVALSDYAGQVVLVNNWATWCPPCKAEMPELERFFKDHRQQNFTIIGIEAGSSTKAVEAFVKDYRLSFPIWPDPSEKSLNAFHNDVLPNSYVIDASGRVRLTWAGAISRKTLEKYVTPLLEE